MRLTLDFLFYLSAYYISRNVGLLADGCLSELHKYFQW